MFGLGHDLREAHGGDAVLTKEARRSLQDPFARRFVVFRGVSHRCNSFLPYLDHDLALRSTRFDVRQRFIRRLEWKDPVHHRADGTCIDQSSNLSQLVAACFHEEEGERRAEALCLSPRAEAQQPGEELHEPRRSDRFTRPLLTVFV